MEGILILGLLVLIILVVTGHSRMQSKLRELREELGILRRQLDRSGKTEVRIESPKQEELKPLTPESYWDKKFNPQPASPLVTPPNPGPAPLPQQSKPAPAAPAPKPAPVFAPPPPPPAPPKPPQPGFFERNPDLEKFIGENLIPKIGIAILVIAIGFFVKYAIDKNWIGPAGRVGIGLLCGGILVGLAHRLHKNYKAFSSVLVGGGLAVFYFSIALAYKDYGLFSQIVAFIIMVVITIFAILLSLLYRSEEHTSELQSH